jgi:hypothetical protein
MVMERVAGSGPRIYMKTPWMAGRHFGYDTIDRALTAAAIYAVRNPLDVAVSLSQFLGVTIDQAVATLCTHNCRTSPGSDTVPEFFGSWSQNVASWLRGPGRRRLIVRYEDLLSDPGTWFTRIARHAVPNAGQEQVDRAIALSSFGRMQQSERATGFVLKSVQAKVFFNQGRAGQWQSALQSRHVDQIVRQHKTQMERMDYRL